MIWKDQEVGAAGRFALHLPQLGKRLPHVRQRPIPGGELRPQAFMMGEAVQQFEMLSDTQQAQVLRLTMGRFDESLAEGLAAD